jgi:hypothetical protein
MGQHSFTMPQEAFDAILSELKDARALLASKPAVPADDVIDLAVALEQRRALHIVAAVRQQGFSKSGTAIPTQAESVFDLACEEIEHRLRTETWELAGVTGPLPKQADEAVTVRESGVSLLTDDHKGMRVDYSGLFKQATASLARGAREPALAEMLRQLKDHITELGTRWYAGDTAVVDEILQLYCVEKDARDTLAARTKDSK